MLLYRQAIFYYQPLHYQINVNLLFKKKKKKEKLYFVIFALFEIHISCVHMLEYVEHLEKRWKKYIVTRRHIKLKLPQRQESIWRKSVLFLFLAQFCLLMILLSNGHLVIKNNGILLCMKWLWGIKVGFHFFLFCVFVSVIRHCWFHKSHGIDNYWHIYVFP